MSHSPVSIKFKWGLSASDPEQKPVLFLGQASHLSALSWHDVRCKLEPKVSEEAWRRGINVACPGELCELWPRAASLGVLPPRRSRHAAPARSHALSKLVRSGLRSSADEFVVLVCRKRDVLASAVAIARAVPLYSARSGPGPLPARLTPPPAPAPAARSTLTVEIHIAQDARAPGPARCPRASRRRPRPHPPRGAPSPWRYTSRRTVSVTTTQLVCRKWDVLASAVAIARAVPLYSARSGPGPLPARLTPPPAPAPAARSTLTVEIHIAQDEGDSEEEGLGPLDPELLENTLSTEELSTVQDVADATRLAARITDTPANIMDVDAFIEEACKVAKDLDIAEPTIIRGEELKERGMGGIYGVGKASVKPPALVALSYSAAGATETVAWVGKGIVYDTGGLSIKARTSMVGMKGDCGGAAAVLAAFSALVRAAPTVNLHAVLCLAENSVGPNATRPDDIHQLYSGRTVEINNTDAEGRLVLSDGVVFAQRDLKADTIVDVATLTGAQGTATGKYHAAIVSNSARLERLCVSAGLVSGDLAHALPFAPELHFSEFSSVVADMKNSVADRSNAMPSCAALFVLAHLGFDFPGAWLHVDMAAPAHAGERATGYGVALLAVLFGGQTRSRLLKALSPNK